MRKKYFFFDIDGTLEVGYPGDQYVPASTALALKKLEENGHFIAIATGRSEAMARSVMESFGMHNMVCDGGNGIVINDELLGIIPLDYDAAVALIDECREKDFIWGFSPDNSKYRLVPDERFQWETNDRYMRSVVIPTAWSKPLSMIASALVALRHLPSAISPYVTASTA